MNTFKTIFGKKFAALTLAVAAVGFGGTTARADGVYGDNTVAVAAAYQPRTMEDLQNLTAPVALYPDALLAQVFVASTYPDDVVAAAQFMQNGGDPNQVGGYNWDASVQGLLQTPDVLYRLAGDVNWMNQLGDAFLNQQADVFSAVQTLRAQAQTAGNLASNEQQQVVCSDNLIEIVPTNPQLIYVPRYDPEVVYVHRPVGFYEPCVTFGGGIHVGLWLHDDCDWNDHRIYVGNWGGDRPWWHHDGGEYLRNRPGTYINNVTNIRNVNNVNINNRTTVWERDGRKTAPRHIEGPVVRRETQTFRTTTNNTIRRDTPSFNNRQQTGNVGRPSVENTRTTIERSTTVNRSGIARQTGDVRPINHTPVVRQPTESRPVNQGGIARQQTEARPVNHGVSSVTQQTDVRTVNRTATGPQRTEARPVNHQTVSTHTTQSVQTTQQHTATPARTEARQVSHQTVSTHTTQSVQTTQQHTAAPARTEARPVSHQTVSTHTTQSVQTTQQHTAAPARTESRPVSHQTVATHTTQSVQTTQQHSAAPAPTVSHTTASATTHTTSRSTESQRTAAHH